MTCVIPVMQVHPFRSDSDMQRLPRSFAGDDYQVVSVIGDGAMTGGVAFEAMNNAGFVKSKMIVILNDNQMSIDKNSGSLSKHLARLRTTQSYQNLKRQVKNTLRGIPGVGVGLVSGIGRVKDSIRYTVIQGGIFEGFGFNYLGPIDGHNIHDLIEVLKAAKTMDGPVLIHTITKKGKGYRNAELDPSKFHGISAFDPDTGETIVKGKKTYSKVFGNKLLELAEEDEKIVAVSAAMVEATGLCPFQLKYPKRLFDVGIAEQHAVSFASGLALNGYRPFVAIYSTFLQRSYDQILEDICLENLPVVFMIDRAGVVGNDGETHHGIFDLSYLSHMPGMTVLAPKNGQELETMMEYALTLNAPCAIRYPRGAVPDQTPTTSKSVFDGKSELLIEGTDATMVAAGKMVEIAADACKILQNKNYHCELINARSIKPIDRDTIISSVRKTGRLVTLEDNIGSGGFGEELLCSLSQSEELGEIRKLGISWPDTFIKHGDTAELFKTYGMDADSIADRVGDFIEGKT